MEHSNDFAFAVGPGIVQLVGLFKSYPINKNFEKNTKNGLKLPFYNLNTNWSLEVENFIFSY